MHASELKLLHYVLEWRKARRDVFRLVGESLEETGFVLLSIQTDNEGFQ